LRLLTKKQRGRKIRERRIALGLSQEGLARRMRCSQSHISYLERGQCGADEKSLESIAKHLEIPVQVLVCELDAGQDASHQL
jgi:transcriptional regulator with XRE-family HTH domain